MLKDFGPILKILGRFILIYIILLGVYQYYLSVSSADGLDGYSTMVANVANQFQEAVGYSSSLLPDPSYQQAYFLIEGRKVTRMVEGCNAISVMILFTAFVFAFYKGKKTLVYIMVSLLILFIMNIVRISTFNIVKFTRPEYGKMFHDYIFPSIIYGTVVVLWLVWVQFFVLKNEKR